MNALTQERFTIEKARRTRRTIEAPKGKLKRGDLGKIARGLVTSQDPLALPECKSYIGNCAEDSLDEDLKS